MTRKNQAAKEQMKMVKFLAPFVILLVLNLLSLALILYRSYVEAAYHYVLLIVYLLVNGYYLFTACRIVVGSPTQTEGSLRIPQEKSGAKPIELPVRYDKGGVWTVDEAADLDAYQAYVYYLFNR